MDDSKQEYELKSPRIGAWLLDLVKAVPEIKIDLGKCVRSLVKELDLEEAGTSGDMADHKHVASIDCAACARDRRIDLQMSGCEAFLFRLGGVKLPEWRY